MSLAISVLFLFVVDYLEYDYARDQDHYESHSQHSKSVSHSHHTASCSRLWIGSSSHGWKSNAEPEYNLYHLSSACLYSSISSDGSMLWKPLKPCSSIAVSVP